MSNKRPRLQPIPKRGDGIFDKSAWLKEARHHRSTARILREAARRRRRTFVSLMQSRTPASHRKIQTTTSEAEACFRASALHAGYSVEMFLKAGLVRAYWGCSEGLFERDVRSRGHRLRRIARDIDFPHKDGDAELLAELQRFVESDARYPQKPLTDGDFPSQVNALTHRIWGRDGFRQWMALATRIEDWVTQIDSSRDDPAGLVHMKIDDDGYFALRWGGRLSPRLTYRFSSFQHEAGEATLESLRELLADLPDGFQKHHVDQHWDAARKTEDRHGRRQRT